MTIYNTILKPIIVYGCEAWSLTTKTESKLQAAEMRGLRLKGVTRRDHIRNTTIRSEMKVESLLQIVERSRLRWHGHVPNENDPGSTCKEVGDQSEGQESDGWKVWMLH